MCFLVVCFMYVHFCWFFLAKNYFVEWFNWLSQMSHAGSIDSVALSVAIYWLIHQSTHLDFESNWLSQFLWKNESIQGYRFSRVESYASLDTISLRWTYISTGFHNLILVRFAFFVNGFCISLLLLLYSVPVLGDSFENDVILSHAGFFS